MTRLSPDAVALLEVAAVAGREFELDVVVEAAGVVPDRILDAVDEVERARLVHPQESAGDGRSFVHGLAREAIYHGLPPGRRARYHHRLGVAVERARASEIDANVNELAHHFAAGASIADAEKAVRYSRAAGARATQALAFEEALAHFARGWEVTDRFGILDAGARCDLLVELADAQFRAGGAGLFTDTIGRAADLARESGDAGRLAQVAIRVGAPTYLGIGPGPDFDEVQLVREALQQLPAADSSRRALLIARLSLMEVGHPRAATHQELQAALERNAIGEAMARRLNDPRILGHVLSTRLRLLWGIESGAERMAAAVELGEIAEATGDGRQALLGHMWRVRELLVRGDLQAVQSEIERTEGRETGPLHPLERAYGHHRSAMMALIRGDYDSADAAIGLAHQAGAEYPQMVRSANSVLMWWTWWQRDAIGRPDNLYWQVMSAGVPEHQRHEAAFIHFRAVVGEREQALRDLVTLLEKDQVTQAATMTEGLSLAMMAAACATLGAQAAQPALELHELTSRFAGTVIVVRAPVAGCLGPADHYLGMLAATMGDHGLAEVHFEAALSVARRLESLPFQIAAEVELARTLRRRRPDEEAERVAELLRHGEESARALGLHRLARLAAEPD